MREVLKRGLSTSCCLPRRTSRCLPSWTIPVLHNAFGLHAGVCHVERDFGWIGFASISRTRGRRRIRLSRREEKEINSVSRGRRENFGNLKIFYEGRFRVWYFLFACSLRTSFAGTDTVKRNNPRSLRQINAAVKKERGESCETSSELFPSLPRIIWEDAGNDVDYYRLRCAGTVK